MITVTSNVRQVVEGMRGLARDVPDKAVVRALNKVADQAAVQLARSIQSVGYKLKSSAVKKRLSVTKASSGRLTARISATGRPVPLTEYGARETAKGVSVNVLNGRKLIPHAFIATMPNGRKMVCIREQNARHKKVRKAGKWVWEGLPIKVLYGPSVADAASNTRVQQDVERFIDDKFEALLRHEVSFLMGRS
jgi:hypothetical protein